MLQPGYSIEDDVESVVIPDARSPLFSFIMALQCQGMPQSDKVAKSFFMLSMRMGGNDVAAHNLRIMLRAQTRN